MKSVFFLLVSALLVPVLGFMLAGPAHAQSEARFGGGAPVDVVADGELTLHQKEKAVVARGNAVATRGDLSLRAETLTAFYRDLPNGETEIYRVLAEGDVRIAAPGQQAFGARAVFDVERNVAVLTGGDLRFVTETDVVTARDSLEYWRTENLAVARGEAIAVRGDNRVRADRLVGLLEEDGRGRMNLSRIDADGAVVITTPRDVARGNKGTYDIVSRLAVLTGDVKITRGRNQLNGNVAEVDLETGVSRLVSGPGDRTSRVRGLFVPETRGDGRNGGQQSGEGPDRGGSG